MSVEQIANSRNLLPDTPLSSVELLGWQQYMERQLGDTVINNGTGHNKKPQRVGRKSNGYGGRSKTRRNSEPKLGQTYPISRAREESLSLLYMAEAKLELVLDFERWFASLNELEIREAEDGKGLLKFWRSEVAEAQKEYDYTLHKAEKARLQALRNSGRARGIGTRPTKEELERAVAKLNEHNRRKRSKR